MTDVVAQRGTQKTSCAAKEEAAGGALADSRTAQEAHVNLQAIYQVDRLLGSPIELRPMLEITIL